MVDRLHIWHYFFYIAECDRELNIVDTRSLILLISDETYLVPCKYKDYSAIQNKSYCILAIYRKISEIHLFSLYNSLTHNKKMIQDTSKKKEEI